MNTYLWLAKDLAGNETAQRVCAASAQEAREQLASRGYTDLRLQKDDVMAETTAGNRVLAQLSPAAEVKVLAEKKPTLIRICWLTLRDSAVIFLICGAYMYRGWLKDRQWVVYTNAAFMTITPIVIFVLRVNPFLFHRLNEAREWHRPRQVMALAKCIHLIGSVTKVTISSQELARYRALALAWEGKLDQAVTEFSKWESSFSPWLFAAHLSGIYDAGKDVDRMVEWSERAAALNPNVATVHIDLAWKHLSHGLSLARAKEAMAVVNALESTEIAKPFILRNNGVIAFLDGRFSEAESLLMESFRVWESKVDLVFRHTNLMLTKAWLCQLHGRLGRVREAREEFSECRPWLEAAQQTFLLEKCKSAI